MTVAEDIAERLNALPESAAITLQIGADNYFDVVQGVLDNFAIRKGLDCIYISTSIPSRSIMQYLTVLEIDMKNVYFVDCISHTMMAIGSRVDNIFYVESPSMLETIMLKVEYLLRRRKDTGKVVFLDSINSLAIHNNISILSEFLHLFVNNLRAKNAYTVILSIQEHGSHEITNMMNMICDETIIVEMGK